MKPTPENAARILFIGLVLLGLAGWLAWHRYDAGRYATYRVHTQDPVSGLIPDAPVELHGVDVGRVDRVDLVDARTVEIQLRLHKNTPITMGTVATVTSRGLATRGFTGYVYVALEDKGDDTRPLTATVKDSVPSIRSTPSSALRRVRRRPIVSNLAHGGKPHARLAAGGRGSIAGRGSSGRMRARSRLERGVSRRSIEATWPALRNAPRPEH